MQTADAAQSALPSQQTMTLPAHIRRIVLTGFMGAGKSTVGRLLAAELGWRFIDIDTAIEEKHGGTVADLFSVHGEEGFRRFESSAIARALHQKHVVIALGGGAPETLTNRLLLEQTPGTFTVFLDAPFVELFDRCVLQAGPIRPNLADPALAEHRFRQRQPLYRRIANLTLNTSNQTAIDTLAAFTNSVTEKQPAR